MFKSTNGKYSYLLKNVGILTISNFSSKILVFLLVPLYTSILSTEEYGIYDLTISTAQMLFLLLTINITDGVLRFLMEKGRERSSVISIGMKYIVAGSVIIAVLLILNNRLHIWDAIIGFELLILLYYVSYSLNQFFIQAAKGMDRVNVMGIAGVLGTLSMVAFNIIFLYVLKMGLSGFYMANILGQAVPAVFFWIRLKIGKYIKLKSDKKLHREMIIYSFPLIFTALGWWVNGTADKYVVSFMCGMAANGLISVSYKIPTILNTFQTIFIQAWQVSAIKEYEEGETVEFYKKTFGYLNAVMCILGSVLIFVNRPIAKILFANDFYEAWRYTPFLLLSNIINSASGFCGPILAARKDSKSMARAAVYGTLVNLILNIILVYAIGIQGATIATAISAFVIYYFRKIACKDAITAKDYWKVPVTWCILTLEAVAEIFAKTYVVFALMIIVFIINGFKLISIARTCIKKLH